MQAGVSAVWVHGQASSGSLLQPGARLSNPGHLGSPAPPLPLICPETLPRRSQVPRPSSPSSGSPLSALVSRHTSALPNASVDLCSWPHKSGSEGQNTFPKVYSTELQLGGI